MFPLLIDRSRWRTVARSPGCSVVVLEMPAIWPHKHCQRNTKSQPHNSWSNWNVSRVSGYKFRFWAFHSWVYDFRPSTCLPLLLVSCKIRSSSNAPLSSLPAFAPLPLAPVRDAATSHPIQSHIIHNSQKFNATCMYCLCVYVSEIVAELNVFVT